MGPMSYPTKSERMTWDKAECLDYFMWLELVLCG